MRNYLGKKTLLSTTVCLTLLAVTAASQSLYAATPKDTLVVAQNIEGMIAIDPAHTFELTSGELISNVYDRLIQYDADSSSSLSAGLADHWEVDVDASKIIFTLRDGAKFHSGNPVRAEDVVFSFHRVVKLNLTPAFILTQLGWTTDNFSKMVYADGNKVVIDYQNDYSPDFLLNVLASRTASIVDEKLVMQHEVNGDLGNAWLNSNSAGSGPFVLDEYEADGFYKLTANPEYFNGAPKIQNVLMKNVTSANEQESMLLADEIDLAKNLSPEQVKKLPADQFSGEIYPQSSVHFFSFNQKDERLTSPALWEAARYLVKYEEMGSTFLAGRMEVHQAFWPKGFPGAYYETPFSYDPKKAKEILAKADFETPITIELDILNVEPFIQMADVLKESFAEVGITLDVVADNASKTIEKYRNREHQAVMLYWGPDYMDPHSNAKAFAYNEDNSDENYQSTTTWRNAWAVPDEINQLTMKALTEINPGKRLGDYIELQKRVQRSSPIVIMFQSDAQVAMKKNVEGYVNGVTSDLIYYRLVTKN